MANNSPNKYDEDFKKSLCRGFLLPAKPFIPQHYSYRAAC